MKKILVSLLFLISSTVHAQGPVCATPGADGVQSNPDPQNSFYPGAGDNSTVLAGSTSFVLEGIPDPFVVGGVLYGFGNQQISKGDLLLVIQIQGASINTENNNRYGSGTGDGSTNGGGSGYLDLHNVGRYEYMVALNDVPASGGELRFRASGTNGGLLYTYENKPADANNGVKRFQVVRLMQYSNLTLTKDVMTTPWNGKAGGIIALDVAGTLNFNGRTINASMTGFRGGYLPSREPIPTQQFSDYTSSIYSPPNSVLGSTKGEGVAGTPRHVWDGYDYLDQGADWIGYPGGDLNRGAPGNAGGGGNVHNAGGGGGGNGGVGGAGGYAWPLTGWNSGGVQKNSFNEGKSLHTGGRPGASLPSQVSDGRLFLGGGGGAGDANNSSNGARGGVGGGIVFITASKIAGTGYILANGGKGEPGDIAGSGDGSGGGGAGGSVFIHVKEPSTGNLVIQARGGNGGHSTTPDLHGPGGGGGGGVIYYNANGVNVTTDVSPGAPGLINGGEPVNPAGYEDYPPGQNKLHNGAFSGEIGVVRSFTTAELPPHLATGSTCFPELTIKKWRDQPLDEIPAGSMVTYKVRIDNTGGGAKGVRIHDVFPASFTLVSATIDFDTEPNNSITLNNIGGPTSAILGTFDLAPGEGADIELLVQVPFLTSEGTYHNGIQVGYLDPTREISEPERVIYPPTHALPGQNTTYIGSNEIIGGSNYHPDQVGEEVVVVKPDLGIEKAIDMACENINDGNTFQIRLLNPNTYEYPLQGVVVTDIIDAELEVIGTRGEGWTFTNTGNTYTLTLDALPGGTGENPYPSEWAYIRVKKKANATKSSWLNTATVPTEKGDASSSVMLYRQPTQATAKEIKFPGECDDGIYYLEGNNPSVGVGKWEFVTNTHPQGGAFFEDVNQYNTRLLGLEPGQTVEVVWTITNSTCGTVSSPPLSFTAPVLATAVISGGGSICAGQPYSDAPAITVTLTPSAGRKRIKYLDGGGFERTILSANNATSIEIPRNSAGTYTLIEIKQSTTITDLNSADWDFVCPGNVSGTAQVHVVSEAPVGGFINYHGGPVCRGGIVPMALVLTGHSGIVVTWQSSEDGSTWSNVPGTAGLTEYSPTVNADTYYRAIIRGAGTGSTPCFPDQASEMVLLTVKDCNDLSIEKVISNPTPDAETPVTFTLTVINNNDLNATGVTVIDKLPNGYAYTSHLAPSGTTYDHETGVWTIGELNAGATRELTIEVIVNSTGQYTNTAVVSCNEQEIDYTNNTAVVTPDVNCDVRNISPKVN